MNPCERPPRLCILTQFYPPEMGAPQARLSELAERLIDIGWNVEVLTALPNYPTGRVFSGYPRRGAVVEQVGRVRTVRVPLWPSKRGFAKRTATCLSFGASAMWFGPRLCTRPDLLWVESPPLFIAPAARYLSRHWQIPFVFNVSDLWPESLVAMGALKEGGMVARAAERFELSTYRASAGVTGQSEEIIESIRLRVPGIRNAVITNGVEPARFGRNLADDNARALIGPEPGPVFVYAGLLGHAQRPEQILDLAERLPADVPGRFVLVGEGPERESLEKRLRRGSSRVKLLPAQPRNRIPALLAAADVALITLGGSIRGAVPSKIYEAMASSLPILLIADGEPVRRVESANAGVCVPTGDPDSAVTACTRLATDPLLRQCMGEAGRRAAETIYDRARIAERLERFLRATLTPDELEIRSPEPKVKSDVGHRAA